MRAKERSDQGNNNEIEIGMLKGEGKERHFLPNAKYKIMDGAEDGEQVCDWSNRCVT